jgi:hypothetical protein
MCHLRVIHTICCGCKGILASPGVPINSCIEAESNGAPGSCKACTIGTNTTLAVEEQHIDMSKTCGPCICKRLRDIRSSNSGMSWDSSAAPSPTRLSKIPLLWLERLPTEWALSAGHQMWRIHLFANRRMCPYEAKVILSHSVKLNITETPPRMIKYSQAAKKLLAIH